MTMSLVGNIMSEPTDQTVPYPAVESLPPAIRADLTPVEQQLYCSTFNRAWRDHDDFADREPFCHRVARSAVRRRHRLSGPGVGQTVAAPGIGS
jgi:cation transport regulator ChaB